CKIAVWGTAYDRAGFRRGRWIRLAFKFLRVLRPDYDLGRDFSYEYEHDRLAIDLINGSELLRQWVDNSSAIPADLDRLAKPDEDSWLDERDSVLLYR